MFVTYNPWLVLLSIIIASLSSLVALTLAGRVANAKGNFRSIWLWAGAVSLGMGIWSTHFISLLSLRLPVPVSYNVYLVAVSLLLAITASALTLSVASHRRLSKINLLIAGCTLALTSLSIHCLGVAALDIPATIKWNPLGIALSAVLALSASIAALWLANYFLSTTTSHDDDQRRQASLLLGLAIYGTFYLALRATDFYFEPSAIGARPATLHITPSTGLAIAIVLATTTILGIALLGALMDRLLQARAGEAEALRRAVETQKFLSEAGALLASSVDADTAIPAITRLAVPSLADWCAIDLVGPDMIPKRTAVAHVDPEKIAQVEEIYKKFPPDHSLPVGVGHVARTGQPQLLHLITDDMIKAYTNDQEHQEALRRLSLNSCIIVPLKVRDRVLGTLSFMYAESQRTYDETDIPLIEELAHRAAIALDNAKLLKDADEARMAATEANRAKSQFLATMSHELRTPLNAIGGYAQILEMGTRGPVTDLQKEDLRRIQRSQKHLVTLVSDVLNFAKLETGTVSFNYGYTPVHELLLTAEATVLPQINAKGINYEYLAHDLSAEIYVDRDRTQQIIINLLSNAIKFTPENGQVIVSWEFSGSREILIHVIDTGRGIPPDKLERIFEPFFQVDHPLSGPNRSQEGVGLGLSISRNIAKSMRGDISVKSTLGHGATFTFCAPTGPPPQKDQADI